MRPTAAAVWGDPGSAFVARFLGHANVLGADDARRLGLPAEPCVVQEAALTIAPTADGGHRARVVDVRFRGATSRVVLDVERAKHWIAVGAQPTDRVARFLDVAGVKERAARTNPKKGVPGEKATERAEERATKAAAAAEAWAMTLAFFQEKLR